MCWDADVLVVVLLSQCRCLVGLCKGAVSGRVEKLRNYYRQLMLLLLPVKGSCQVTGRNGSNQKGLVPSPSPGLPGSL